MKTNLKFLVMFMNFFKKTITMYFMSEKTRMR